MTDRDFSKPQASIKRALKWISENPYADAFGEFITVWFLSSLPFFYLILSHLLKTDHAEPSAATAYSVLRDNWKPGEVLVLVSALLAPVSYLMIVYQRAGRHMFGYGPLSLILIAMYGISAYIFGYDRMNAIKNEGFVKSTSLWLYGAALVIWYFGLVYQRKLNRAPTDNSSNRADRMAKELEKES